MLLDLHEEVRALPEASRKAILNLVRAMRDQIAP
jgi:hypothetical protein